MGRKSKLEAVFEQLRRGASLYSACRKNNIQTREFYQLLAQNPGLKEDFKLALSDYADQCIDDIRALAQALKDGNIDNSTAKLLIETQKWLAQKVCPDLFDGFQQGIDEDKVSEIVVKFV